MRNLRERFSLKNSPQLYYPDNQNTIITLLICSILFILSYSKIFCQFPTLRYMGDRQRFSEGGSLFPLPSSIDYVTLQFVGKTSSPLTLFSSTISDLERKQGVK